MQLKTLRRRMNDITKTQRKLANTRVKVVTISVQVFAPGEIELQLTYLVSGQACWEPSYGMR